MIAILNFKEYEILLDIYKGVLNPQDIRFVTEDNGKCKLKFRITANNVPYDLTGAIVRMTLKWQQKDCKIINATEGTLEIELPASMLSVAGDYKSELKLYDATNQILRLTTPTFRYNIRKSLMTDEEVRYDPNFSILQNMIVDVQVANELAIDTVAKADTALELATNTVAQGNKAEQQGNVAESKGAIAESKGNAAEVKGNVAESKGTIAEGKGIEAKNQADYAKAQGDYAKAEGNKANIATVDTIAATTAAVTSTTNANKATADAVVATGNANTQANFAKAQGDYAKAEGDKVANRITLDNLPGTNFNFIRRNVVQDGLISNVINSGKPVLTGITSDVWSVVFKGVSTDFSKMDGDAVWYLLGQNINLLIRGYDGALLINDNRGEMVWTGFDNLKRGIPFEIIAVRQKFKLTLTINGITKIFNCPNATLNDLPIGHYGSWGSSYNNYGYFSAFSYNRILTPQEVQHNFSVLSNPQSYDQLAVTDNANKTTILRNGAFGDTVLHRTGRTEEQEYMGVLSTMGQEFTADATGVISASNCLDARVIGASVSGNTVKGYAFSDTIKTINKIGDARYYNFTQKTTLLENKIYNLIIDASNVVPNLIISIMNEAGIVVTSVITLNSNGISVLPFTLVANKEYNISKIFVSSASTEGCSAIIRKACVVDTGINSIVPFGLSSMECVLNNGGASYPIYEPIINGKTVVLRSPKGANTWTEINADEVRDTTLYDYKLSSVNGDLGSVGTVADSVDRASKVKTVTTKEIVLNGSENWINLSGYDTGTSKLFSLVISDIKIQGSSSKNVTSNIFTPTSIIQLINDSISVNENSSNNINICISKSKLTTPDINGFKAWLQTNPTTVRYQLATPTTVQLTDEQFKAYDAYKKLILCSKVGDVADTFAIEKDGSGTYYNNRIVFRLSKAYNMSIYSNGTDTNVTTFAVDTSTLNLSATAWTSKKNLLCTHLQPMDDEATKLPYGITIFNTGWIYVCLPNSLLTTLAEFKAWLDSNIVIIDAPLKSTAYKTTIIPKEAMPTIATSASQINIFGVEGPVLPSSFSAVIPTSDGIKKSYPVTLLNNYVTVSGSFAPRVTLTQDNRVEVSVNLTSPATFNATMFSLDPAIRPSKDAWLNGFVDNIGTRILVKATGEVQLPNSVISKNVAIKDSFRLGVL